MASRSLLSKAVRERRKIDRTFLTNCNPIPILSQKPLLRSSQPTNLVIYRPPLHAGPLFLSPYPWMLSQSATPLIHHLKLESLGLIDSGRGKTKETDSAHVVNNVERIQGNDSVKFELKTSFLNAPNYISFLRLVSGPFIGWMIVEEMHTAAFFVLAISGSTDWLDGYVARKIKIDSVVGSYLDPLADKVLIGSVAVAMVHMNLLHAGLVGLVIFRDVGLIGGALLHRAKNLEWKWNKWTEFVNLDGSRPEKVEPLLISKINTVMQLGLVAAALLQPDFGSSETQSFITFLSWLVASTTVASMLAYGSQYFTKGSILLSKKS